MGLSLEEALTAATLNAAYSLDLASEAGSLEIGKRADLVVLRSARLLDLVRVGVAGDPRRGEGRPRGGARRPPRLGQRARGSIDASRRMSTLLVENLTKTYPGTRKTPAVEAVRGISFSVEPGEFFGLLGPERRRQEHDARLHHARWCARRAAASWWTALDVGKRPAAGSSGGSRWCRRCATSTAT